MARYSIAANTVTVSSGTAALELIASSSIRLNLISIGIFNSAATAGTFGVGVPAIGGITPSSPIIGLPDDGNGPNGTGQIATAWGTPPTVPTQFLRKFDLPATESAGMIISFPKGYLISITKSIVLWNIASNGVVEVYCIWDE